MNKVLFIYLVSVTLADEVKQEPGSRTSRGIILGSSGSDGGPSASFYGKLDSLSYGSEAGHDGSVGGHDFGNGLIFGTEGSYPFHSFGDSSISAHNVRGHSLGLISVGESKGMLNFGEYNIGGLSHRERSHGEGIVVDQQADLGGAGSISSYIVGGRYEGGDSNEYEYNRSVQPFRIHHEPNVHETTKAIPVHETLNIPIHHPVRQTIKIPVPFKVPVPYAINIPIPVPVEKTVNVPVEKVIHYPVEKPIPIKVVKKVHVPVSKPYPVPYPVYKVRFVYHTKKVHHGHHQHGHHY